MSKSTKDLASEKSSVEQATKAGHKHHSASEAPNTVKRKVAVIAESIKKLEESGVHNVPELDDSIWGESKAGTTGDHEKLSDEEFHDTQPQRVRPVHTEVKPKPKKSHADHDSFKTWKANMTPLSSDEKRAVSEFRGLKPDANDEDVFIFLCGYRIKQDYLLVSLKSQVELMDQVLGHIAAASTGIARSSADIVESTTSATSKLAIAVTEVLSATGELKRASSTSIKGPHIETSKLQGSSTIKSEANDTLSSIASDNQKISAVIQDAHSSKGSGETKVKLTQPPIIQTGVEKDKGKAPMVGGARSSVTKYEVSKIIGVNLDDFKKFYGMSDEQLDRVCAEIKGPLPDLIKDMGDMAAVKGYVKRIINKIRTNTK